MVTTGTLGTFNHTPMAMTSGHFKWPDYVVKNMSVMDGAKSFHLPKMSGWEVGNTSMDDRHVKEIQRCSSSLCGLCQGQERTPGHSL